MNENVIPFRLPAPIPEPNPAAPGIERLRARLEAAAERYIQAHTQLVIEFTIASVNSVMDGIPESVAQAMVAEVRRDTEEKIRKDTEQRMQEAINKLRQGLPPDGPA